MDSQDWGTGGSKHTYSTYNKRYKVCSTVREHENYVCDSRNAENCHEGVSCCEGGIVRVEFHPRLGAVDAGMEGEIHIGVLIYSLLESIEN